MLGDISFDDYLKELLLEPYSDHKDDEDVPFISIGNIYKIPYVEYPMFNNIENQSILSAAKEALLIARNENGGKEVAITYDLSSDPQFPDYCVVFGDAKSVKIMDDPKTVALIEKAQNLTIINIHNHPRGTGISFQDLAIFLAKDNIRLMCIVSNEGDIASLLRCEKIPAIEILQSTLLKIVPDLAARNKPGLSIDDLIKNDEKRQLLRELLPQLKKYGIIYTGYITKEKAKEASIDIKREYEEITRSHCLLPKINQNVQPNNIPTSLNEDSIRIKRKEENIKSAKFIMLCGLPGVGKSKIAKEKAQNLADNGYAEVPMREFLKDSRPDLPQKANSFTVINLSEIRTWATDIGEPMLAREDFSIAQQIASYALNHGISVIYDACNLRKDTRDAFMKSLSGIELQEKSLIIVSLKDQDTPVPPFLTNLTEANWDKMKKTLIENPPQNDKGWDSIETILTDPIIDKEKSYGLEYDNDDIWDSRF